MSYIWEPHSPAGRHRVVESSCCDTYHLCHEVPHYLVTRWAGSRLEETARGGYEFAYTVWVELSKQHQHGTAS